MRIFAIASMAFAAIAPGAGPAFAQVATAAPVELATPLHFQRGFLQGATEEGLAVYRGIPFAKAPTALLRWRPPQRLGPITGTFDATRFKAACMQRGPTLPGMMETYSEDCLYLNIWSPSTSLKDKLPVMVYLYGGGGISGSGSVHLYWGDQLAKKGVVVVTLNYRVGILGFLAHPELTAEAGTSGNYGLLDIIAALRWIKENIGAFGGNPANVTLFGQSAGAYWESMLMISPNARGLFRRVIASSGGEFGTEAAIDVFPSLHVAEQAGVSYVQTMGMHSMREMRQLPAEKLVMKDSEVVGATTETANIDGHLIPAGVRSRYEAGKQAHVDLIVGWNADEGVNTPGPRSGAFEYLERTRLQYGSLSDRFLSLYPAGSDEDAARSQVRDRTDDVAWRMLSWARLQSGAGVARVFVYRFSTIPPFMPWPKLNAAGHGSELSYVFGFPPVALLAGYEAPDKAAMHARIAQQMQSYWTNFAKTGDPNGPGLPEWPTFSNGRLRLLEMGDAFVAGDSPDPEAMRLRDEVHAVRH